MTLNALLKTLLTNLLETAGDGTGGGAAAGDGAGAGNTAAGTAANGQGTGDGAAAAAGAQPGAKDSGFTYREDRSNWIPKHRFDEVNQKASEAAALKAQLAERDQKIAALAGVAPNDPKSQKAEEVKAAFFQMFPQMKHLSSLTDEQMKRLLQAPEVADRATEIEQREWRRHGAAQMKVVFTKVADELGTDSLSDTQKEDLSNGFARWLRAKCKAEQDATGESKTLQRYEDGDPAVLDEFVKRYTSDWVEPARRKATTQTLNRTRPVPSSQGRSNVTSVQRPEKFKSLDDRLDYAASVLKDQGAFAG